MYSINIAKCRGCIYDFALEGALAPVAASLMAPTNQTPFQFFCWNHDAQLSHKIGGVIDLEAEIAPFPQTSVPKKIRKSLNWNDQFCYIYTSGTTGLPKAAAGDHGRYTLGSMISLVLAGFKPEDRIYTGLPLYHSSGQWFAMGSSVCGGCTVILRKSFSASKFWPDCVKYQATVTQYIGEIARFLLARPPCPEETQHQIRMVAGVGMRPKIWKEFVERFKVRFLQLHESHFDKFCKLYRFHWSLKCMGQLRVQLVSSIHKTKLEPLDFCPDYFHLYR